MRNYKQPGDIIHVVTPYDVAQGSGVKINNLFGLATATRKAGEALDLICKGDFDVSKVSAEAWAVGDKVYWNNTSKLFTVNGVGGLLVGLASGVAVNPSDTGSLLLAQQPGLVDGVLNPLTGVIANSTWNGTQAQYDAIVTKDANTIYLVA